MATNPAVKGPRLRLRLTVDPEMGEFYAWCLGMTDRVRAREVLMAARLWRGLAVVGGVPAGALPHQAASAPAPAHAAQVTHPRRESAGSAASVGRKFASARPRMEDMQA